jgi:YD repeat-containing protein
VTVTAFDAAGNPTKVKTTRGTTDSYDVFEYDAEGETVTVDGTHGTLYQGDRQLRYGQMAVASLAGMAPVYLLAVFFQRWLIRGLTSGVGR